MKDHFVVWNLTGEIAYINRYVESRKTGKIFPGDCIQYRGEMFRTRVTTANYQTSFSNTNDILYLFPDKYVSIRVWSSLYEKFYEDWKKYNSDSSSPEDTGWVLKDGKYVDKKVSVCPR